MSISLEGSPQNFEGHSSQTKPEGVPAGSTYCAKDTGAIYTYDGSAWIAGDRRPMPVAWRVDPEGALVPDQDDARDIGSERRRVKDLHLARDIFLGDPAAPGGRASFSREFEYLHWGPTEADQHAMAFMTFASGPVAPVVGNPHDRQAIVFYVNYGGTADWIYNLADGDSVPQPLLVIGQTELWLGGATGWTNSVADWLIDALSNLVQGVPSFVELRQLAEDPAAPADGKVRFYAVDAGGGKTEFRARFPTGAAQVLATEP